LGVPLPRGHYSQNSQNSLASRLQPSTTKSRRSIDLAKKQRGTAWASRRDYFEHHAPHPWLTGLLDDLWGTPISLRLPSIEHHVSALL
jgi:hypothetical protein